MTGLIVGTGETTYQVIHPFGKLPGEMDFGSVSHVATDSQDRVYVYQRKDPPVMVFDGDGNLLTTWGASVLVDGHGIYIGPQDEVFLIDRDAHEMLKFNTEGKVLLRLGNRGRPAFQAPFNHPADVAVSSSGDIYVADGYGNSNVHRFSSDGKHLGSWGEPGAGPGQFTTPHGIWVDDRDRVYLADRENDRVQIFSPEGDYITEWRDFFHPMDIFGDAQGRLYVTDQIPRISVLDGEGRLLSRGKTVANAPHGIWGDSKGNLYTAGVNQGVTKFAKLQAG